jgi:hypothetical protein
VIDNALRVPRLISGSKIGSVPTPWPSWLIAAHPSPERASEEAVRRFLADLTAYVRRFDSEENRAVKDIDFIKEKFGYPEEDIKARFECLEGSILTCFHRLGFVPSVMQMIAAWCQEMSLKTH